MAFNQCWTEKVLRWEVMFEVGLSLPVLWSLGVCSMEVLQAATSLWTPWTFCAVLCLLYLLSLWRWTDSDQPCMPCVWLPVKRAQVLVLQGLKKDAQQLEMQVIYSREMGKTGAGHFGAVMVLWIHFLSLPPSLQPCVVYEE